MEIGTLFLKSNSTGIITFSELDWITTHQSNFTRLEESIAIKLGRMLDSGSINIGDYYGAVEEKVASETLSKVLYPNDGTDEGRRLRLNNNISLLVVPFKIC